MVASHIFIELVVNRYIPRRDISYGIIGIFCIFL